MDLIALLVGIGVTMVTAKKLVAKYRFMKYLAAATVDDLQTATGISPELAENISKYAKSKVGGQKSDKTTESD